MAGNQAQISSKTKLVSTGYAPRAHQQIIHANIKRFSVLVLHRRFGKTHLALNELIDNGLRCTLKNPQYAYIAPTYGQAKRVAWDILKDYVKHIPNVEINESELRIDIHRPALGDRVRFMLLGAENPNAILGIYLDGVVLDEYADINPEVWGRIIRPLLSDRMGWAIFTGTPRGQNHFYDLWMQAKSDPSWYACMYKASETGIISQSELEAARASMSEAEYMQEFECSFAAALVGAYYGKEIEHLETVHHVTKVPYDPGLPVYTAWDLGLDDSTAIWFCQVYGKEVRLIDYEESSNAGLDYYVKLISAKPYNYAEHLLPHDVATRELTTGKSRLESLKKMGLKNVRVVQKLGVEDGINASRLLLARCWFDMDKCKRGLMALKSYQRKWDSKNKVFQARPSHDWASHGADAFRMLAVGLREDAPSPEDKKKYPRYSEKDFSVV